LAPEPYRGKRNEPAYVAKVVQAIAELKSLDPVEVGKLTAENARRLFKIDQKEQQEPGRLVYSYKSSLYINLTNRCSQFCRFCLKAKGYRHMGVSLALMREPEIEEVILSVKNELDKKHYEEVVFCGLGEPLLRLEEVKQISTWLHESGVKVRVNTNGLASLTHLRPVPIELSGLVDVISVSLNAPDAESFMRICPSIYGRRAFEAVCDFIKDCTQVKPKMIVQATAVGIPGIDHNQTKMLANSLGAEFRVRHIQD
jgi:TatD DNase family protein